MKKIVKRCLPLLLALFSAMTAVAAPEEERPNIVLIMVDDMGFSDLGFMGGEIETPNLDRLASEGVRFSRFYNGSRCCPTRASLMAGLNPHLTGIGHMTNPPPPKQGAHDAGDGFPNYRGKCKDGWDVVRRRRHERQIKLGLMDPRWKLSPRPDDVPEWSSLDQKKREDKFYPKPFRKNFLKP